jgi:hypothetical protein
MVEDNPGGLSGLFYLVIGRASQNWVRGLEEEVKS